MTRTSAASVERRPLPAAALRQDVRFCATSDGVRIAYATSGSGPPLVATPDWMSHLEFNWESPVFGHLYRALSAGNTLVRHDSRGNGLSDWGLARVAPADFVTDLEAVVEAAGVGRFPLFASGQGCAAAIEFAVRHPERVGKLILHGGYARGWRHSGDPAFEQRAEALLTLTRGGWGRDNAAFRQLFTSLFIPDATSEQKDWFNRLQRITTSPENAARILSSHGDVNVLDRLERVTQPTLVVHARNDARIPYVNGSKLAKKIPGATFVTLESKNHLILEQEPAWPRFIAEIAAFLAS